MCYFDSMKYTATRGYKKSRPAANPHSLAAAKYQKIYDGRKHRVRGLWKRGDTFYAQLSLPDADGNKRVLINSGEPNNHFIRDCGVCE